MKQLVGAIFLLLILGLHHSGSQLIFTVQRARIRREIKQRIKQGVPQEELIIFRFARKELTELDWKKKNEFRLNGGMYDVVSRENRGPDSVWLHCINDRQEAVLFASLEKDMNRIWNSGASRNRQQRVVNMLSSYYLTAEVPLLYPGFITVHTAFSAYSFQVSTWSPEQHAPPPRPTA